MSKRKLLSPSFGSFPVIVGTGRHGTLDGTRIYTKIVEAPKGSTSTWEPLEPLSSLVFLNSAKPLRERWRDMVMGGSQGETTATMHEYVFRRACRLEDES